MVIRTIKLTSLFVNTENYRFEPLSSQKEAIDKFMNHPQARQLWADTKAYLEKLKLEEPIG